MIMIMFPGPRFLQVTCVARKSRQVQPEMASSARTCLFVDAESLKQAVGHEAIKLLVNVDEDDYERGRVTLLQNLTA